MAIDYSVECALPYALDLSDEQQKFELAFNGLANRIRESGQTFHRVLLVDDVTNEAGEGFDLNAYSNASANNNTLVMRESMLNELAGSLLEQVDLSHDEITELKTEAGFSSPFYIATWTLLRLGYLEHPDFPPEQISARIANVLPENFREGEEESMRIISNTPFRQAVEQVEYTYV
jgi:hypothetical protein